MKIEVLRRLAASCLMMLAVLVWGYVIWLACHVSLIILETLEQIVDLAAISP